LKKVKEVETKSKKAEDREMKQKREVRGKNKEATGRKGREKKIGRKTINSRPNSLFTPMLLYNRELGLNQLGIKPLP